MKYWNPVLCIIACGLSQTALMHADELPEFSYDSSSCYTPCPTSECCAECCDQLTYSPIRLSAAGVVGQGIGGDNQNAILEFFYAPETCHDEWQAFIDIKGHHLGSSNSWAANGGVGVRVLSSCDRTLGANIFYDYRRYRGVNFNQVGVGLESLGNTFDFRINGYFPFKKRISYGVVFDDYIGDYIVEALQYWNPMTGVDGEVGVTMLNNGCFGLYGAIGPYYYWNTATNNYFSKRNAFGGMARLAFQWTDYVDLEVRVTYDNIFKTKVQGLLQLTLPFEACFDFCNWTKNVCSNIFLKPVSRREVIVLHHSGFLWLGNY